MRKIRAAISRPDCKVRSDADETLGRLLWRLRWDLGNEDDEEEGEELESEVEEEFPLTFLAHLEIASSTLAAIAPKRLAASRVEADSDEDEVDIMEGSV